MKIIEIQKRDLINKLKPKYFIIILSSEENLYKCINNKTAGFPETTNGKWAYLDINKGDFLSFYYNGRIFHLYRVNNKFIPYEFRNKIAIGNEEYDPVSLGNNEKWKAIPSKKGNVYFPYRLSLELLVETDFITSIIFKESFERFGINLVPRVSFKKSHFQLLINDIKKFFNDIKTEIFQNESVVTFSDFIELAVKDNKNVSNLKIKDITDEEVFLQVLIKRVLESAVDKYFEPLFRKEVNDINALEFLSEQTVYGGEADIVIAYHSENIAFIEVKNREILKINGNYTNKGEEALKQIMTYRDIINPNKEIIRCVAGKREYKNEETVLRIIDKNGVYVIEVNTRFTIF